MIMYAGIPSRKDKLYNLLIMFIGSATNESIFGNFANWHVGIQLYRIKGE